MILLNNLLKICRKNSEILILIPFISFVLIFIWFFRENGKTEARAAFKLDESFGSLKFQNDVVLPRIQAHLTSRSRIEHLLESREMTDVPEKEKRLIKKSYRVSHVSNLGIFTVRVEAYSPKVARRFLDYVELTMTINKTEGICESFDKKLKPSKNIDLFEEVLGDKKINEPFTRIVSSPDLEELETCLKFQFAPPIQMINRIEVSPTPIFRERAKVYIFILLFGLIWAISISVYRYSVSEK